MKAYTYSEAREKFAAVLEEAERYGAVEIRRRDGALFRITPAAKPGTSPLDVPGVAVSIPTTEWVEVIRAGRERPD